MKKIRFIYLIFMFLALGVLLTVSIVFEEYIMLALIGTTILSIINITLKRKEVNEIKDIIIEFLNTCESDIYISRLNNYAKKCIFTKKQRKYFNLYLALAHIEQGTLDKSYEYLMEIDTIANEFKSFTKFVYFKTWCDYFFCMRQKEKMNVLLSEMNNIIDSTKNGQLRFQLIHVYQLVTIKYGILINGNIDEITMYLQTKAKFENTRYQKLYNMYLQALTDIRANRPNEAISKLKELVSENKNIFICKEANRILNNINHQS